MTGRARRIQRLRRRVAVAAAATFAAAFGTVAANGSMGTATASAPSDPATTAAATTSGLPADAGIITTTQADVPSAVTTHQS